MQDPKSLAPMTIISLLRVSSLLTAIALASCAGGENHGKTGRVTHPLSVALVDAAGTRVELNEPARRVVSLAPNLTESLCAIGGENLLVGRTSYCDYPPSVTRVPVVGNLQSADYEKIVALGPDIILMTLAGNSQASYRKLQELGLVPFALDASSVDGVVNVLDTIGMLIGRREQAQRVSDSLRRRVASVRAAAATYPAVPVFLVVNRKPLMTVSRGYLSEALELAGGHNIARGAGIVYPTYSREELVRRDPEVIIVPGSTMAAIDDLLASYPEWRRLRAVREGSVRLVPPDPLMRPGPRLIDAIEDLFDQLHAQR